MGGVLFSYRILTDAKDETFPLQAECVSLPPSSLLQCVPAYETVREGGAQSDARELWPGERGWGRHIRRAGGTLSDIVSLPRTGCRIIKHLLLALCAGEVLHCQGSLVGR